jgi:diguanylate cyclase (GGDEF)-like protein
MPTSARRRSRPTRIAPAAAWAAGVLPLAAPPAEVHRTPGCHQQPAFACDDLGAVARHLDAAEQRARAGLVDDAIVDCEALLPRLQPVGCEALRALCHHVLMLCHHYAGRTQESTLAGYRAIELFGSAAGAERLLRTLALQAINVARLGDAPEALDLLDRGMQQLAAESASARERCLFWNNAGVVYHVLGQFSLAVDAAEKAGALLGGVIDADLPFVCACNLLTYRVELARSRGAAALADELPAALDALLAHIGPPQASERHHLIARCVEAAVEAMIVLQRFADARVLLRRQIGALRLHGTAPKRGGLELRLAQIERLDGRRIAAARHVAAALELLAEGHDQFQLARAHQEQSLLDEARGRWRAALESHKRHAEIRERVLKAQADGRAQALAVRLDLERSRAEAELLRRRNAELEGSMHRLHSEAGELKRQALEDPLTGLANRRQLQLGVADLRGRHRDEPLTVLVIDIDHFKRINDEHSHAVGDAVLSEMGRLLRQWSRPDDVVARVGGEEFVVVFGGALRLAGAVQVAERMRRAIEGHDWSLDPPSLRVTVSIGLAAYRAGEPFEAALMRADAGLYECKRAGRNQVRWVH